MRTKKMSREELEKEIDDLTALKNTLRDLHELTILYHEAVGFQKCLKKHNLK